MKQLLFLFLSMFSITSQAINFGDRFSASGLVYKEYFYEEPNFGERPDKDKIASACMMKLDYPAKLSSGKVIKSVELLFPSYQEVRCAQFMGHRVAFFGILNEAVTGHQHGDAIFDATKVRVIR